MIAVNRPRATSSVTPSSAVTARVPCPCTLTRSDVLSTASRIGSAGRYRVVAVALSARAVARAGRRPVRSAIRGSAIRGSAIRGSAIRGSASAARHPRLSHPRLGPCRPRLGRCRPGLGQLRRQLGPLRPRLGRHRPRPAPPGAPQPSASEPAGLGLSAGRRTVQRIRLDVGRLRGAGSGGIPAPPAQPAPRPRLVLVVRHIGPRSGRRALGRSAGGSPSGHGVPAGVGARGVALGRIDDRSPQDLGALLGPAGAGVPGAAQVVAGPLHHRRAPTVLVVAFGPALVAPAARAVLAERAAVAVRRGSIRCGTTVARGASVRVTGRPATGRGGAPVIDPVGAAAVGSAVERPLVDARGPHTLVRSTGPWLLDPPVPVVPVHSAERLLDPPVPVLPVHSAERLLEPRVRVPISGIAERGLVDPLGPPPVARIARERVVQQGVPSAPIPVPAGGITPSGTIIVAVRLTLERGLDPPAEAAPIPAGPGVRDPPGPVAVLESAEPGVVGPGAPVAVTRLPVVHAAQHRVVHPSSPSASLRPAQRGLVAASGPPAVLGAARVAAVRGPAVAARPAARRLI